MAVVPWLNSTTLVEAIKRKISIPSISIAAGYSPFTDQELLAFANEEMSIAVVPQVLEYHSEYFVVTEQVPLLPNKTRYSIPQRAIGFRIREMFYQDTSGNLYEMVGINLTDKSWFQYSSANDFGYRYYLEGNDIVLPATSVPNPTGNLLISYYQRPNQLVETSQAFIVSNFFNTIQCVNASISNGDTVTLTINTDEVDTDYVLTAVSGAPSTNEFQIGGTSIITAQNLVTALNDLGLISLTSVTNNSTDTVTLKFTNVRTSLATDNSAGFSIPITLGLESSSTTPTIFVAGTVIDFLQTKPGHKTLGLSKTITGVGSNTMTFTQSIVPTDMIVGDYVCLENECIIPQIPTDLHIGLAERACARVLASIGDREGLQVVEGKIQQVEKMQSPLLGARDDGSVRKVFNRRSLLQTGKYNNYRKF